MRAHLIDEQEFGEARVNILKFVEVNESEDMEIQKSFNVEGKESQNQGVGQNPGASKLEITEVKESGKNYF